MGAIVATGESNGEAASLHLLVDACYRTFTMGGMVLLR
jgi:hypothetical protein